MGMSRGVAVGGAAVTERAGRAAWRAAGIVVALCGVAFAVRVWALGSAALSFDEAVDLRYGTLSIAEMLTTLAARSIHPPLHYFGLHGILAVAGTTEFAARFASVVAGVLVVPLTFALAREVFAGDGRAGVAALVVGAPAAALVTLSPFLLYYAQETRMYSTAACLATLALVLFLRAVRLGGTWLWVGYALALAGMLYTQYLSVFLVPAFLVGALLAGRVTLRRWLLAVVGAATLYLAWLPSMAGQFLYLLRNPDYHPDRLSASGVLANILAGFGGSESFVAGMLAFAALLGGLVWVAGWGWRTAQPVAARLLVTLLAALLPAVSTAILASLMPKFATRYAIVAAPAVFVGLAALAFLLLWGRGRAARLVYAAGLAAALIIVGWRGWDAAQGGWFGQEDSRRMAQYLSERARPDDSILLVEDAPDALRYYYRGDTPWVGMHVGFDFERGAQALNQFLATRPERVWLVLWHHEFADPTGMVITELARRSKGAPFVRNSIPGYSLVRYELDDWSPVSATPTPQQPLDVHFEDALNLVGADRLDDQGRTARWILYWQAARQLDRQYSIALQFRGPDGQVRLTHDQSPSMPYLQAQNFPPGQTIRGLTEVELPQDLAPGRYDVDVLVWDTGDQRNLSVVDATGQPTGIAARLGQVEVIAPPPGK